MPRYDVDAITKALLRWKAQDASQEQIAAECGIGVSTLSRHITEYRAGNRPDIQVGELPAPRSGGARGQRRASAGNASLVRVTQGLSAATHADRMASDAAAMEDEAGRLEAEAERLRADAGKLREAATLLSGQ